MSDAVGSDSLWNRKTSTHNYNPMIDLRNKPENAKDEQCTANGKKEVVKWFFYPLSSAFRQVREKCSESIYETVETK